jgi:hypothetical protein
VSRTTVLVFVALGAGLAGFAFSTTAERLQNEGDDAGTTAAARPQTAMLGWREMYGKTSQKLVFSVQSLHVLSGGWRARVALENQTATSFVVNDPKVTVNRYFGLMLFSSGKHEDLDRRNESGELPAVRHAMRYEPSLPRILEPGRSWAGTISAPGALAAGSWVRVVFGALISVGQPPADLDEYVVWITDHAHRLR